MLEILFGR
jgi:hypothetical protein